MTTTVFTKYRGAKEFFLVYSELVNAARHRGTVTYSQVAELMGIHETGHHMAAETGHLLGEISEDEDGYGRPLLSAVAISSVTGMPGPGFFKLARELGKVTGDEGDLEFWEREKEAVYCAWQ